MLRTEEAHVEVLMRLTRLMRLMRLMRYTIAACVAAILEPAIPPETTILDYNIQWAIACPHLGLSLTSRKADAGASGALNNYGVRRSSTELINHC